MPPGNSPKKRGRPLNPYTRQRWNEGWPYRHADRFDGRAELAAIPTDDGKGLDAYLAPLVPGESQVETAIRWILSRATGPDGKNPVPLVRTLIEATLNFDHHAPPRVVTDALNRICARKDVRPELRVYRTKLPIEDQSKMTDVYSIGRLPTPSELETLDRLSRQRQKDFDRQKASRAEFYVWELLYRTGRFDLNDKSKCGNVTAISDGKKHRLDVLAIDTATKARFGISVKNIRERIHPGKNGKLHPFINDALAKAKAHGAYPVLVAAHLTPEAEDACRSNGVIPHSLHRQLLPQELPDGRLMSKVVRDLEVVLGPQRFEYLPRLRWTDPPPSGSYTARP